MRSLLTCMLIAVAASVAAAQTCVAPSANLFDVSGTCFMYCRIGLCACTGSNALSTFPTCLASNTGSCAATQTCYARYLHCLVSTVTTRSNASDPCSTLGTNLYMAQLAAAASSTFNTSNLAQSCGYATCVLANQTGNMGSCTGSAVSTAVCNAANLIGTAAPPTAWTPGVYDIVFTLRISGTSWNLILQNATAKALTFSALTADLAKLWGIDAKWVVIQSLDVGSLVAVVAVQQGSSKSPSQLSTAISATQNTTASWLSSLQSLYSTVSSETLTTLGVTITQTAAPTTTLSPTTAPTSSGFGVNTLWATAAVAAVAALWV